MCSGPEFNSVQQKKGSIADQRRKSMRVLSLVLCICLVMALTAFAQTDRGTITGTVADATGAVIPGATVEARNVGTGAVYRAGSSETGNFTLAQLPAGTYEVSVLLP